MEIIIIFLFIVIFLLYRDNTNKKKQTHPFNTNNNHSFEQSKSDQENDRIKKILATDLRANPLMNKSEFKTFKVLNSLLKNKHYQQGYRLFPQVSLGGFIQVNNNNKFQYWSKEEKDAFWAYNSLRADFLIIDRFGTPVLVIEYQGSGHRLSNSSDRDIRKRYACQNAGIELIEVFDLFDEVDAEKVSLFLNQHSEKLA